MVNLLTNWIEDCDQIADFAFDLSRDAAKIVAAWQRIDKLKMETMVQSLYHINWSLRDISENMPEITRKPRPKVKLSFDDLKYDDHEELNAADLEERTRAWYSACAEFLRILQKVLSGMDSLGARPKVITIMASRLCLDMEFFSKQALRAFGGNPL